MQLAAMWSFWRWRDPSIHPPSCPSNPPIHQSIYPTWPIWLYLKVYLRIFPIIYPFIFLSIYLSVCLSVCLSVYVPIYLSVYLVLFFSICVSCMMMFVYSSVLQFKSISNINHSRYQIYGCIQLFSLYLFVCDSLWVNQWCLQLAVNDKLLMFHMVATRGGIVTWLGPGMLRAWVLGPSWLGLWLSR